MESRLLKPFSEYLPNPSEIYVSDKKGQTPYATTPEEFASKNGFTWIEGTYIDSEDAEELTADKVGTSKGIYSIAEVAQQMKTYGNSIAISYMGEELGYGAVATKNIPANVFIANYAGVSYIFRPSTPMEDSLSTRQIGLSDPAKKVIGAVSAKKFQNVCAFFQHAPSSLGDYQSEKTHKSTIATENLALVLAKFDSVKYPLYLFKTREAVPKGHYLVWDYSIEDYWYPLNMYPLLFTVKGDLVDTNTYYVNRLAITIRLPNKQAIKIAVDREQLYSNPGDLAFEPNGIDETFVITKEDFWGKYNKAPYAPFLIFDRPSFSKPRATRALQVAESEKESAATPSTASSPADNSSSNDFFKNLSLGLNGPATKSICGELKRISQQFGFVQWVFNKEKDIAFIVTDESKKEALEQLRDYLAENEVVIKHANPILKGKVTPTMYVMKPDVKKLSNIPELQKKPIATPRC